MNKLISKLSQLRDKFYTNRHLRVGLPFILAIGIGPTLMQNFVEIQLIFGKVSNADKLQEELRKKESPEKMREKIFQQGYKEMIEDRKEFLDNWEPVRVNRSWEEHDDTFKSYVTKEELRLKD